MSRRLRVWAVAAGAVLSLLGTTSATGTPVLVASASVGAGAQAADTKASEGAWRGMTRRVSVGPRATQPNGESASPVISASGRYVVFPSAASNLVPQDTNRGLDTFVADRVARVTRRVSVGPGGRQANVDNGFEDSPAISRSGRYVAFTSHSTNLVPADTNRSLDVFMRDRAANVTRRVSVGPGGRQGRGISGNPSISADGRYVAFESEASNLVPGDTNRSIDVFVRDRVARVTRRVS